MRYRLLGHSGLKVSEICLGTMTFGGESAIGSGKDECRRMYDAYRAAGGNFIDTANIYTGGTSERYLSEYIAADRQGIVLASKFSMTTHPADPNAGGNTRKNLRQALDASLARLGTDYLDLYWVHAWDQTTPLEELVRGLEDAVRAGKILYTGFSNVPAWVVARAQTLAELRGCTPFVALQLHYSLVERNIEREHLPCAAALGLAVTAWSPLAGGLLTGKYSADPAIRAAQPGRLTTTAWGRGFLNDRAFAIAEVVKRVAARMGATPSQIAIAWLLQRPGNVIPVIGARTLPQLEDVLGSTRVVLDVPSHAELEAATRLEMGYPGALLSSEAGTRMVHGDHGRV